MKYIIVAALVVFTSMRASAQKSVFYGDAGVSLARGYPGGSITYNYNLARFIGLGLGFQAYDFHATMTNFQYVPAIYGELRFDIRPRRQNQFFAFLDAGTDFYKHNNSYWGDDNYVYNVQKDNGVYTGLGFGYFRRITKRGWGPYATLKLISNSYEANQYNVWTGQQKNSGWGDGTLVISVGYKF